MASFIPNHSFENRTCCPSSFSQMNCVFGWQQASTLATSDYFNTCGFTFLAPFTGLTFNPPPLPIADGEGYTGVFDGRDLIVSQNDYKEYVGICLTDTMFAGRNYTLKFHVAYSRGSLLNKISLFGTNNCSYLPFSSGSVTGTGCPQTSTNSWSELDFINITLDSTKWIEVTFNFTPTLDITTIVLGPSCKVVSGANYYYLDNLVMNESSKFGPDATINSTGSFCLNDLVLFANYDSIPNSIQWYKDSIAIVGETSDSYSIPENSSGTYQVKLLFDSGCIIRSYTTKLNSLEIEMPNVFSPNNDRSNDIFHPIKYRCISNATLTIYNRWGQIVHETSDSPQIWDGKFKGKNCSAGVYFWILQYKGENGDEVIKGNVSLFR